MLEYELFYSSCCLKVKLLVFHIHAPSYKTKIKRMSYCKLYTIKRNESGKLEIKQTSLLSFTFCLLMDPNTRS